MVKRRFMITGITMIILLSCYLLYMYLVSPWLIVPVEPVSGNAGLPQANAPSDEDPVSESALVRYAPMLKILFPDPNDWRCHDANMIVPKSGFGLLLFRGDPKISRDGMTLQLETCTIVALAGDETMPEKERYRRAFVLETTENVILTFMQPISRYMEPDFSSFEKGELNGQVIVRSDMDKPGPEDDLKFVTRNVTFSMTQILANNEVMFQVGMANGDGEGLTVELNMPELRLSSNEQTPAVQEPPLSPLAREFKDGNIGSGLTVHRIELRQLNRLQFPIPAKMATSNMIPSAVPAPPITGSNPVVNEGEVPLVDLRCKKGVLFAPNPEVPAGWIGRFMEDVEVLVLNPREKHDSLKCRNLYLYFADPELESLFEQAKKNGSFVQRKKQPTGKLARLEPRSLKAVRTEDTPVRIDIPRYSFKAEGDEFVYNIPTQTLTLQAMSSSQRVFLSKDNVTIRGEMVGYTMGKNKDPGTVVAGKNGLLETSIERDGSLVRFRSSWKEGLRICPERDNPELLRVSMVGGIEFFMDGLGTISAEEADFWGRYDKKNGANIPATNSNGESPFAALSKIVPNSAQFRGNINMTTTSGSANIHEELTMRFQETQTVATSSPGVASSPQTQAKPKQGGFLGQGGSLFGGESGSQYNLSAGKLDLWIVSQNQEKKVARVLIRKNVRFHEKNPKETDLPIRIDGDEVQIVDPDSQNTVVDLVGNTASFQGKGLQLAGYHVNINRHSNSFAVIGPGKLTLVPTKDIQSSVNDSLFLTNDPVDVLWSREMKFDGQTLAFRATDGQEVTVSQKASAIKCAEIRLSLKKPVSIFEMQTSSQDGKTSLLSELDLIECLGDGPRPVRVEVFTLGNQAATGNNTIESAFYRGQFENFLFKYSTGDFAGRGPGFIRASIKTNPENPSPNTATTMNNTLAASSKNLTAKPWKQLHLTFQESLTGNAYQKTAVVNRQIDSVFCSTDQRETDLDVAKPESFPKEAVYLNCDQMQISQTAANPNESGFLELMASGNTLFRYDIIVGRGHSIKYSDEKKVVYLEGDGIVPASLYKRDHPGAKTESLGKFMRMSYNILTEKVEVESYSNNVSGF